jgi:alginate O-acetyltransferase complex protein AlgI
MSTAIDYLVGRRLAMTSERHTRKMWLLVSLVGNLGLLGFFKYFNFFVDSAAALIRLLGFGVSVHSLQIILPLGISFYTFQTMSYSIDVYRNRIPTTRSILDFALFVAFFPQLVAGPIVRAAEFLPQLKSLKRWADVPVKSCLLLFLFGYIKKACIADNLAPITDAYWANPTAYSAAGSVAAGLAFSIQLFCDFAGYSEMAIACGGLLGYTLPENFRHPYFSRNIRIFWTRWHMTLSRWVYDYVFIPMTRYTRVPSWGNYLIVFTLIGLWHGANWNFAIWGALHGLAMVVHRNFLKSRFRDTSLARFLGAVGPILTFGWVYASGVFFRSPDFKTALIVFKELVLLQSAGTESFGMAIWVIFAGLAVVHWISYRKLIHLRWEAFGPWLFPVTYGAAVSLALVLSNVGYVPFYYFVF